MEPIQIALSVETALPLFSPSPQLLVLTNPLHVHDLCKIARFYLFIYALFMPFLLSAKMQFLPIMYPFEYNASYHCFWDLRRERHFDQNWISAGVGRNWPSVCSSLSHLLSSFCPLSILDSLVNMTKNSQLTPSFLFLPLSILVCFCKYDWN